MVDQQRTGCFGNRGTDHDVQSNEETSFVDGLTNVVTLSESQTTSDRSTSARSNTRVEAINIEAQVDGQVPVGVDVVQSQLNDLADTVLVDLMHAERLDAVLLEDAALALVDVAQADVHEAVRLEQRLHPCEFLYLGPEAEQEGERHAVDVPCNGRCAGQNERQGGTGPGQKARESQGRGSRAELGSTDVPESVVSAVLMSACASTQTTQASGYFLRCRKTCQDITTRRALGGVTHSKVPEMVPMAYSRLENEFYC